MSKTLVSVLVLAVVLVGGYMIVKNGRAPEDAVKNPQDSSETAGKKIAFSEFVKQGGSYKCEVKQAMNDFENSGTVYITEGKMRGEFSTVAEGQKMDSLFVMKDDYMYNWSSLSPELGVKIKVTAEDKAAAEAQGIYSWNTEQVGDYNCEPWTVDNSKFDLPQAVNFMEIKAQ